MEKSRKAGCIVKCEEVSLGNCDRFDMCVKTDRVEDV